MTGISNKYGIHESVEWSAKEADLLHTTVGLKHEKELRKMIANIQVTVTELSRAEVEARRGKKLHAEELLTKINSDIELIEGYLLVAALIG